LWSWRRVHRAAPSLVVDTDDAGLREEARALARANAFEHFNSPLCVAERNLGTFSSP
jgi:hypothetical protein